MGSASIDRAGVDRFLATDVRAVRERLGAAILADSQVLVPVDTGELKASGFVDSDDRVTRVGYGPALSSNRGTLYTYPAGDVVSHAGFVEFGTSRMRAQPYLRPAALRYRDGA